MSISKGPGTGKRQLNETQDKGVASISQSEPTHDISHSQITSISQESLKELVFLQVVITLVAEISGTSSPKKCQQEEEGRP